MLVSESFVAFPDDDCWYHPSTLLEIESLFSKYPEYDSIVCEWHGIGMPAPSAQPPKVDRLSKTQALRRTPTYVLFFRRVATERAVHFDTQLGPGAGTPWLCGEDADYLLRAGVFSETAASCGLSLVAHPVVDSGWTKQKAFGYGRGRMRVLAKHRYSLLFRVAMVLHAIAMLLRRPSERDVRFHFFLGRLFELVRPSKPNR
jgi:hypothetical protein